MLRFAARCAILSIALALILWEGAKATKAIAQVIFAESPRNGLRSALTIASRKDMI